MGFIIVVVIMTRLLRQARSLIRPHAHTLTRPVSHSFARTPTRLHAHLLTRPVTHSFIQTREDLW